MTHPIIETPRGKILVNEPTMKAELIWNPNFKDKWQGRYTPAQKFVDSEVLRGCEPYVPLLTGMMIMSGILGTFIGSGTVQWIAPYSRHQYYSKRAPGSQTGPLRGPYWFPRWKVVGGPGVITGARKIAGGGV
jgi:hypothetical protein